MNSEAVALHAVSRAQKQADSAAIQTRVVMMAFDPWAAPVFRASDFHARFLLEKRLLDTARKIAPAESVASVGDVSRFLLAVDIAAPQKIALAAIVEALEAESKHPLNFNRYALSFWVYDAREMGFTGLERGSGFASLPSAFERLICSGMVAEAACRRAAANAFAAELPKVNTA